MAAPTSNALPSIETTFDKAPGGSNHTTPSATPTIKRPTPLVGRWGDYAWDNFCAAEGEEGAPTESPLLQAGASGTNILLAAAAGGSGQSPEKKQQQGEKQKQDQDETAADGDSSPRAVHDTAPSSPTEQAGPTLLTVPPQKPQGVHAPPAAPPQPPQQQQQAQQYQDPMRSTTPQFSAPPSKNNRVPANGGGHPHQQDYSNLPAPQPGAFTGPGISSPPTSGFDSPERTNSTLPGGLDMSMPASRQQSTASFGMGGGGGNGAAPRGGVHAPYYPQQQQGGAPPPTAGGVTTPPGPTSLSSSFNQLLPPGLDKTLSGQHPSSTRGDTFNVNGSNEGGHGRGNNNNNNRKRPQHQQQGGSPIPPAAHFGAGNSNQRHPSNQQGGSGLPPPHHQHSGGPAAGMMNMPGGMFGMPPQQGGGYGPSGGMWGGGMPPGGMWGAGVNPYGGAFPAAGGGIPPQPGPHSSGGFNPATFPAAAGMNGASQAAHHHPGAGSQGPSPVPQPGFHAGAGGASVGGQAGGGGVYGGAATQQISRFPPPPPPSQHTLETLEGDGSDPALGRTIAKRWYKKQLNSQIAHTSIPPCPEPDFTLHSLETWLRNAGEWWKLNYADMKTSIIHGPPSNGPAPQPSSASRRKREQREIEVADKDRRTQAMRDGFTPPNSQPGSRNNRQRKQGGGEGSNPPSQPGSRNNRVKNAPGTSNNATPPPSLPGSQPGSRTNRRRTTDNATPGGGGANPATAHWLEDFRTSATTTPANVPNWSMAGEGGPGVAAPSSTTPPLSPPPQQ